MVASSPRERFSTCTMSLCRSMAWKRLPMNTVPSSVVSTVGDRLARDALEHLGRSIASLQELRPGEACEDVLHQQHVGHLRPSRVRGFLAAQRAA